MPKQCQAEGCEYNVWGKGFCLYHQNLRLDKKKSSKKKALRIKPISDKQAERLKEYKVARGLYLADHPTCEAKFEGCLRDANQVHHKRGRLGSLLTDANHFLAVCHSCHVKIESEPLLAKELGYSENRFIIKKK